MQCAVFVLFFTLSVANIAAGNVYNFYDTGKSNKFVAFSVGRKTDYTATEISRMPMDVEFYNDEKHFDMEKNAFTAPISGVYSFSYGAGSINGKKMHLNLKAGNPEVDIVRIFDFNTNFGFGSSNVILKLNKGDTASIWGRTGHTAHGVAGHPPSTYFTGHLVKALEPECNK